MRKNPELVYAVVTLISATACGDPTGQLESRQNINKLLSKVDTKRQELRIQYGDSLLASVEAYQHAQLSYHRAFTLVEDNSIDHAIPHAKSAVALMDDAKLGMMKREFEESRSSILKHQLALIKLTNADELAQSAEINFRQALQEYQFKKFQSALQNIKKAQSQYEIVLQSAMGSK